MEQLAQTWSEYLAHGIFREKNWKFPSNKCGMKNTKKYKCQVQDVTSSKGATLSHDIVKKIMSVKCK
jgi:hypothetical protein